MNWVPLADNILLRHLEAQSNIFSVFRIRPCHDRVPCSVPHCHYLNLPLKTSNKYDLVP